MNSRLNQHSLWVVRCRNAEAAPLCCFRCCSREMAALRLGGGGSVTMEMPRGGGKRAVSEGGDEDATACAGAKGGRKLHQ